MQLWLAVNDESAPGAVDRDAPLEQAAQQNNGNIHMSRVPKAGLHVSRPHEKDKEHCGFPSCRSNYFSQFATLFIDAKTKCLPFWLGDAKSFWSTVTTEHLLGLPIKYAATVHHSIPGSHSITFTTANLRKAPAAYKLQRSRRIVSRLQHTLRTSEDVIHR